MFFKLADRPKQEGEEFKPCVHNTCGIPNSMIIANISDVPEINIKYNYPNMYERTLGELVEIMKCMNLKGKFTSKEWLCRTLNFGERKGDDLIVDLKKRGLIEEVYAVHHARMKGFYYRLAGRKWKRVMQKQHALLRRSLRAVNQESFNSPKKGSLPQEKPFSNPSFVEEPRVEEKTEVLTQNPENNINSSESERPWNYGKDGGELGDQPLVVVPEEHGYAVLPRRKPNNIPGLKRKHYPDGKPGDGKDNSCYSAEGCMSRVMDAVNNPYDNFITNKIIELSSDKIFIPSFARSLCRRIDAGTISKASLIALEDYLNKNPNKGFTVIKIIKNFESIIAPAFDMFIREELPSWNEQITRMVTASKLKNFLPNFKLALELAENAVKENYSYFKFLGMFQWRTSLPFYCRLASLVCSKADEETIVSPFIQEHKSEIFDEIIGNLEVYNFMKALNSMYSMPGLDWDLIDNSRVRTVANMKTIFQIHNYKHHSLEALVDKIINKQENINDTDTRAFSVSA